MARLPPAIVGLWVGLLVALARASDILFTWHLNPSLSREQNPTVAFGSGGWALLIATSSAVSILCGMLAAWHWKHRPTMVPRASGLSLRQFVMRYYFGEDRPRTDLLMRTPSLARILLVLGLLLPAVMVFASLAIDLAHWIAWTWPEARPLHNWWAGHPVRLLAMYALWMGIGAGLAWLVEWRIYRQTLSGTIRSAAS